MLSIARYHHHHLTYLSAIGDHFPRFIRETLQLLGESPLSDLRFHNMSSETHLGGGAPMTGIIKRSKMLIISSANHNETLGKGVEIISYADKMDDKYKRNRRINK